MQKLIGILLSPSWNRLVISGLILTVLGVLLTPVIVGIPFLGVGFGLLSLGIIVSLAERLPGGKRVVDEFRLMFNRMFNFVRKLIKEVFN
jgi:Na+/phosphate symporter